MRRLWFALIVLIFLGLLTLFLLPVGVQAKSSQSNVREIQISARAFEYTPRIIRVQRGERVKLILIADDVMHGLILETYDVKIESQPKQDPPSSVEFVGRQIPLSLHGSLRPAPSVHGGRARCRAI